MNQFGMSPLAGIQTGTINAADLMGWTDRVGTLEPGKWADIIAIDGDPLKDVKIPSACELRHEVRRSLQRRDAYALIAKITHEFLSRRFALAHMPHNPGAHKG